MLDIKAISSHSALVMAIVNVTDNSFLSSSKALTYEDIVAKVNKHIDGGADIIDIGGYASNPMAGDVPMEVEWERVNLGLKAVRAVNSTITISVDTFRSEIVERAVKNYGQIIVNDISGGQADQMMYSVVAKYNLPYIMMHMRGVPQNMMSKTDYGDLVGDIHHYFEQNIDTALKNGVTKSNIILDLGFGFAKNIEQNYHLLGSLNAFKDFGLPILVGISNKSMIYKVLGIEPSQAYIGTEVLHWQALIGGAKILRTHDAEKTKQTIKLYNTFIENNDSSKTYL